MLKLTVDQLGIPIEVNDTVMFAISIDNNYTSRRDCSYYEGTVISIDDWDLKVGKWNHSIKIRANKHSNQTILELTKQSKGLESMEYAHNKNDARRILNEKETEEYMFYSNDVICVTKAKQLVATHYAEYFI